MKKNKLLFGSLIAVCGLLTISNSNSINNLYRLLASEETNIIHIGDSIDIENRSLDVSGTQVPAKAIVYFPDGSSFSGKSFIASEPGLYRVVYTADNGSSHQVSETVNYKCVRLASDMFDCNGNVTLSSGEYKYNNQGKNTISGAIAEFKVGSSITFSNLVDITSFDKSKPILDYIIEPNILGVADFKALTIRFTDSIDETNYVDVSCTDSGEIDCDGMAHYVRAGARGQIQWGFEGDYDSHNGKWHYEKYGQSIYSSFRGWPVSDTTHDFKLFFDYPEKAIYASPQMWSVDKLAFINDLDSSEKYMVNPWLGFPSGKAKITIIPSEFNNATGKIVIKSIAGMDLSNITLDDVTAPNIDINYLDQSPNNLPRAVVGRKYNIFPANVSDDFDEDLEVQTSVTYLDTKNNREIDVSVIDNAFVPRHEGTYTITYSASDKSGNNATSKKVKIFSRNNVENINVTIPTTEITSTIFDEVNIPSINDVSVSGGTGKINVTRKIFTPNNEEISVNGDSFVPNMVGEYRVVFEASDYINNVSTKTLVIKANKLSAPIFIGEADLPPVMVKGFKYTITSFKAIETATNEIEEFESTILVNGEAISGPITATGTSMEITYSASGKTGTTNKTYIVPVIDGNNTVDQCNYFYGNLNKISNEDDIALCSTNDGEVTFATKLNPSELSVLFMINNEKDNFEKIKLKLVDSTNVSHSLTFYITNESDSKIIINDGSERDFQQTPNGEYKFYFDNILKSVFDINNNQLSQISKFDNGDEFNGFSDGAYLSIGLVGVTGESEINIRKINNQPLGDKALGNENFDSIKPTISYDSEFIAEQKIGDVFAYPTFKAFDVLSDIDSLSIKIVSPSGKLIVNCDAEEHKTFTISEYGSYIISFIASETSGNILKLNRTVYVYDDIAPTLSVNKLSSTSYNVGDVVKIPGYQASDNSGAVIVDVILVLPDSQMRLLTHEEEGVVTSYIMDEVIYPSSFRVDKNSFRTEQKGTHTLRFIARDAEYNKTVVELKFEVK